MSINWQDVVTTVGSSTVALAAVSWLIKTGLTHRLSREADEFKLRLQAQADAENARLKNSLQMTALEHQVRFSKLHERRAEFIAELYERLVKLILVGERFVATDVFTDQRSQGNNEFNRTLEEFQDFSIFVESRRIYLTEDAYDLLAGFLQDLRKIVIDVGVWGTVSFPNLDTQKQFLNSVSQAFKRFSTDLPKVRKQLEKELRRILEGESEPTRSTIESA